MLKGFQKNSHRGKQILKIIGEHGPLSLSMVQKMILPTMPKKNLKLSLRILEEKKLIKLLPSLNKEDFYMLPQSLEDRTNLAQALNCDPESLIKFPPKRQDRFHHGWCEYWILSMKRKFPNAEVIREIEIGSSPIALNILQMSANSFDLRPDCLLIFSGSTKHDTVAIAIEIERTRKSNCRLMKKLKKYVDGTRLDGLIYICDTTPLQDTIKSLYTTQILDKTQRQKRFGENFFLFSESLDGGGIGFPNLINARGKSTSFDAWIGYLSTTKWIKRRDEDFHLLT